MGNVRRSLAPTKSLRRSLGLSPSGRRRSVRRIFTNPNDAALSLAKEWGADETVKVEDGYVDTVLEMTDGKGAEVVFDYVGERGAEDDAWKMTRQGGSHFVIGYGGTVEVPTIDIISTERVITGNLVGTYNDLAELMNTLPPPRRCVRQIRASQESSSSFLTTLPSFMINLRLSGFWRMAMFSRGLPATTSRSASLPS